MHAVRLSILALALAGCASAAPAPATLAPAAPAAHARLADEPVACDDLAVVRAEDITAVEPLWVPTPLVKSPAYSLGGVIIELHGDLDLTRARLQHAVDCRAACASPAPDDLLAVRGVKASVVADDGRLTMVLRADDPASARALLQRAEQLHRGR